MTARPSSFSVPAAFCNNPAIHRLPSCSTSQVAQAILAKARGQPKRRQIYCYRLLQETGLAYDDLDAIEFNEAFAVIDVLFARSQPQVLDRYNRFGGALAYGHPYGASGAVLVLHALHSLAAVHGRYGLAAIAGAGGTGEALLLEACP